MYGEIGWHFFVLTFIKTLFMMLCWWCRLLFFLPMMPPHQKIFFLTEKDFPNFCGIRSMRLSAQSSIKPLRHPPQHPKTQIANRVQRVEMPGPLTRQYIVCQGKTLRLQSRGPSWSFVLLIRRIPNGEGVHRPGYYQGLDLLTNL